MEKKKLLKFFGTLQKMKVLSNSNEDVPCVQGLCCEVLPLGPIPKALGSQTLPMDELITMGKP
jgi:hypothetical protein